jgi:RHS repeat-associated protein
VVGGDGVVVERFSFSAFGVASILAPDYSERAASALAWNFLFHGQFEDTETGWQNYGFRYYMPSLGRWPSRDPIGSGSETSVYGYVKNEPTSNIDHLGLFQQKVAGEGDLVIEAGDVEIDPNGVSTLKGPVSVGMHGRARFEYSGNIEIDTGSIGALRCIITGSTDSVDITSVSDDGSSSRCKRICGKINTLEERKFLKRIVKKALDSALADSGIADARACTDEDASCPEKTLVKGWDGSWSGTVQVPKTSLIRELGRELFGKKGDYPDYCSCKVTVGNFEIKGRINKE